MLASIHSKGSSCNSVLQFARFDGMTGFQGSVVRELLTIKKLKCGHDSSDPLAESIVFLFRMLGTDIFRKRSLQEEMLLQATFLSRADALILGTLLIRARM